MDTALYVKEVGAMVNDSTKYTIDIDNISVTNIVLINHFQSLYEWVNTNMVDPEEIEDREIILARLEQYALCLKKELNFYQSKVNVDDCILTEVEGYIKMETNE